MRELTPTDAAHAILGGGVFACGGGGWKTHGEVMGQMATTVGRPVLAHPDELDDEAWVATVTAIGAPAAPHWEIQPADYVHALETLMRNVDVSITAVMTAQNGYSTTLNGWIQSAMLGVVVLDAAGDVRAHPTGKLGAMGLTTRENYTATQVVFGGNRQRHGRLVSINRGTVVTCDNVLRDISVRTGGFIAAARNPVELTWVREHAAIGAISAALALGRVMRESQSRSGGAGRATIDAVVAQLGAIVHDEGPLSFATALHTRGGFDHGTLRVGACTVPFLNEYMAIVSDGERRSSYPDTIAVLSTDSGLPVAIKDARAGMEVTLISVPASRLPLSTSAIDPLALRECEEIMSIDLLRYLPADVR